MATVNPQLRQLFRLQQAPAQGCKIAAAEFVSNTSGGNKGFCYAEESAIEATLIGRASVYISRHRRIFSIYYRIRISNNHKY